jgi:S1-C subfamily serine protease
VAWQSRTWLHAEVDAEPSATSAIVVEADGRSSDRRVHQIATKYAPHGDYSVTGHVPLGSTSVSEELRFSVPSDDAEEVLAAIRQEPGVRHAWLGDSFRNT